MEVGGLEMIAFKIQENLSFLQLLALDCHMFIKAFILVWQNEWAISFFIQTGVWNYRPLGTVHLSRGLSAAL